MNHESGKSDSFAKAGGARLIVWEPRGVWAARLRVHLPWPWEIRQVLWLEACLESLRQSPSDLVVAQATPTMLVDVLSLAGTLRRDFPAARLVAVADWRHAAWEATLREAGAVYFATSPRQADEVASIALRHAARLPRQRLPVAQRVWQSLPWPEMAVDRQPTPANPHTDEQT